MSFFFMFWKSRVIKRKCDIYKQEKAFAIESQENSESSNEAIHVSQLWQLPFVLKERLKEAYDFCFPEGTRRRKHADDMITSGTFSNFVLKSLLGFGCGFFLTYFVFVFFVFILGFSLVFTTLFCSGLGMFLTVGMAFSESARCIVFLTVPYLLSKRGRRTIIAFAFAFVVSGPLKNTTYNIGVLTDSMTCQQEQLRKVIRNVVDAVKKPFIAMKNAFKKLMNTLKKIGNKMKDILLSIKRMIMSIIGMIGKAFRWLFSVLNICNKEVGTPFQRCSRVFEESVADCQAKLGAHFSWVCSIVYIVKQICYIVKIFDYICMLIDFVKDSIVAPVQNKLRSFADGIKNTFYVSVRFHHHFNIQANTSKPLKDIPKDIADYLNERRQKFLKIVGWLTTTSTGLMILLVLKVLHYKYRYLIDDHFDNKYITKPFRDIDMLRAKQDRETVLPLTRMESLKYANVTSILLLKSESKLLRKNIFMLFSITMKICFILAIDYCLWWVLALIKFHGSRAHLGDNAPPTLGIHVQGENIVSEILKAVISAVQTILPIPNTSFEMCLPDPAPPNFYKYMQIAIAVFCAWLIVFVEPYGLRIRQYVMAYYHKDRAQQRAVWLYNKILSDRARHMKIFRRKLRREFNTKNEKKSFKDRIGALIRWKWLRLLLDIETPPHCFLCGTKQKASGIDSSLIKCESPGCIGVYCIPCFHELGNLCTLCRNPIEYGDVSDISEERDSSEEESMLDSKTVKKKKSKRKSEKHKTNTDRKALLSFLKEDSYEDEEDFDAKKEASEDDYENSEVVEVRTVILSSQPQFFQPTETYYGKEVDEYELESASSYQRLVPEKRYIPSEVLDLNYQYCSDEFTRRLLKDENDIKIKEAIERKNALKKSLVSEHIFIPRVIKDFASLQDFKELKVDRFSMHLTPTQSNITVEEIECFGDISSRPTHANSVERDVFDIAMSTIRNSESSSTSSSVDWIFTPV